MVSKKQLAPTVISLFASCGGSSLGYKMAGFKELLAIDFNDNSVKAFKLNFLNVKVWKKDISLTTGQEIFDSTKLKSKDLDVLDGSPPCQGFSISGKRKVTDKRNNLTLEFVRLIKELQPKTFLMENVPSMCQGRMKGKFIEIMLALKKINYKVKVVILDTSYYGVPQARKRLIFIGVRKDLGKQPSFPKKLKNQSVMFDFKELSNVSAVISSQSWGGWNTNIKPSPTLTKSASEYCLDVNGKKRSLTVSEVKAICSFPQDFQLVGSIAQQKARLGNAVMPRFMYYLAKHIKEVILNNSTISTK